MLFCITAYLTGSIPSGILLARAFGLTDPRESGSGNIGASNMARLGGKRIGLLTFVLDFLKGFLPVLAALLLARETPSIVYFTALSAVLGHCYSIFLFFEGGKGVATAAGALFPVAPIPMLAALVAWALCFYCFRITSLAAMAALAVLLSVLLGLRADPVLLGVALACCLVVVRRHDVNLRSLLEGEERSF